MVAVGGNQPRVSSKLVSQKLSVGFLASRHVNRSFRFVLAFKIREKSSSSLLWFRSSQSQSRSETRRKEKFPFFFRALEERGIEGDNAAGLRTKNFSARVGNIEQRFRSRSPRGAPFQSAVARRRVEKTRAEDRFLVSRVR